MKGQENETNWINEMSLVDFDLSSLNLLSQQELNERRTDITGVIDDNTVFVKPKFVSSEKMQIVEDLPNLEYHKTDGFVSSSRLKSLNVTEWHFVNYIGSTAPAFAFGNVVHDDIEKRIKLGSFVNWAASALKAKTTIKQDKLEISNEYLKIIKQYRKDFENNKTLLNLTENCLSEVSFFDFDRMVKVRPDIITQVGDDIVIFDIKTVASIHWFNSDIRKYKYDLSAGMYADVIEKATRKKVRWCFLLICKVTGLTKLVEVKDKTLQEWKFGFASLLDDVNGINLDRPQGYKKEMI
jgi:hypothetical protein